MKSTPGFDYRTGEPILLTTDQWHAAVKGLRHVVWDKETAFYDHHNKLVIEMYGRLNVRKEPRANVPTMPAGIVITEDGNPWD